MRRRALRFRAFAALTLVWCLAASGASQNQAQKVLRHDAAAVVKLVPVRVLDATGRPVRGLGKGDFALRDNGELKTITEFEAHESGDTGFADAANAADLAAARVRPETGRKYFFILDMQATGMFGNRDAKNAVLEFVENHLHPGDEACVMTFGALTGLVLREYLTADLGKIRLAIRRSIEMGGGGGGGAPIIVGGAGRSAEEEERLERYVGEAGQTEASGRVAGRTKIEMTATAGGRELVDEEAGAVRIELDTAGGGSLARASRTKADFDSSMAELAKAMKYVPGSKHVVYFSTRTPGKAVGRLFAEVNATIYAVNTNTVPAKGGGAGAGLAREMKKRQGEALKEFAEAAGGTYFAELKDAKAIARDVEALSGNYYVLGYYISQSWDGRLHELKVTVNRPDLQVLYQTGYSDPKPFAMLSELEKRLQLFDLVFSEVPVSTEALNLPLTVLFGSAMKEANAALLFKLAVEEKTGIPPGRTELFAFVFDKDRKIVVAERGELDSTPHAHKVLFPYLLTLIPPGEYEVRGLARHMETGESAASRFKFTVPAPAAPAGMSLCSPLLLLPGKKAEFVRMSRPKKKEIEPASIVRFYPFLPKDCAPLVEDVPPDAEAVWVLLPIECGSGEISETLLDVTQTRADDGTEVPVDWGLIDSKRADSGTTFLLIGIGVSGLQPGAYTLEFSLKDGRTGSKTSVTATLTKK